MRVPVLRNAGGMLLVELLIVGLLVGIVFVGVASMFVSGMKQAGRMRDTVVNMDPKATVEGIAKKIGFANEVESPNDDTLRIRLDYSVAVNGDLTALQSPADFTDDQWIKYRFRNCGGGWPDGLYWRTDAANLPDADCTGSDPLSQLLIPNVVRGPSEFELTDARTVRIMVRYNPPGGGSVNNIETAVSLTSKPLG